MRIGFYTGNNNIAHAHTYTHTHARIVYVYAVQCNSCLLKIRYLFSGQSLPSSLGEVSVKTNVHPHRLKMFIFRSERFIKKHHPDISRPSCWGSLLELPMVKPGIQEVPEPPAVAALEEDPYVFQVLKSSPNADVTFFLVSMLLPFTTFYFCIFWWFDL